MKTFNKGSLTRNTLILLVSTLFSHLLSVFLLPVLTYYINPEDFGRYEMISSLIPFFYVIFSIQSVEVAFRFLPESNSIDSKKTILTNSLLISIFGILIFTPVILILFNSNYLISILIIFLTFSSQVIMNLFLHSARAEERTTLFSVVHLFVQISTTILNFFFIFFLRLNYIFLLLTPIIINTLVSIFFFLYKPISNLVDFKFVSLNKIVRYLKFSVPLIPNAILILFTINIGRFMLLYFFGLSEVGYLSISIKFPMLFEVLVSVFLQAWQVKSIQIKSNPNYKTYLNNVFVRFLRISFSLLIIFLPLSHLLISHFFSESYRSVLYAIPIFLSAFFLKSLSSFFGILLFSKSKTFTMLKISSIYIIFYSIIGFFLVQRYGYIGVAITQLIIEGLKLVITFMSVNLNFKFDFKQSHFIILFILFIISISLFYYQNLLLEIVLIIVSSLLLLFINFNDFRSVILNVFNMIEMNKKKS